MAALFLPLVPGPRVSAAVTALEAAVDLNNAIEMNILEKPETQSTRISVV